MTTAYSYCVNFGKYSANISAYNPDTYTLFKTQDEAHTYGLKEAHRLATEGSGNVTSLEVEKFCVECDGRGFNVVKSGKRVIRRKEVKCVVCVGKDRRLAGALRLWIRTAKHHFNLDKVTCTTIFDNELRIYLVDNDTPLTLQGEEAKQVLDYLDNISCPAWGLEVPEITEEYKES